MTPIELNLQFEDQGYGLTHFVQRIDIEGREEPLEIEATDFEAREGKRVNAIAQPAWEWFCAHESAVKNYLARELLIRLDEMRKQGEKFVPDTDYGTLRGQLTIPARITFYEDDEDGAFEIFYWVRFNETRYSVYVTMTKRFDYETVGILTLGGFKPPKLAAKPRLKTAAALYRHHKERGSEKGLYKAYAALSAREIEKYVDLLIADDRESEEYLDRALYLALFAHAGGEKLPDRLYRHLIDHEIFYYGEIYLRADEKFAEELIAALATIDDEEAYRLVANHLLCALAAIPCQRVNDFLIEKSRKPLPIWARKLHIPPRNYAHVGGWETIEGGAPRKLFGETVTAFARCEKKRASPSSPLVPLPDVCGFCGQPLTLAFDGERKLATCLYCSCYQTIYTKAGHWHEKNALGDFLQKHPKYMKNEEEITARFEHGLTPSREKRRATWTANQFAEITRTQLGGMPTAINDVEYPACPDCGKTLRFAAQLDMADVENNGEGLYYFFTCDDCGVTAANYGQS